MFLQMVTKVGSIASEAHLFLWVELFLGIGRVGFLS